ncbi:MAG: M20/M25/M40 family metallo-hydrolase [Elusimicrobia bacterium]|nr:M20/M25/M40 family metallo-hydrolase [Elusimicrobiota bacterium]
MNGERLRRKVVALAGAIGERNLFVPEALAGARDWLKAELSRAGYEPELQGWKVGKHQVHNVIAERPGTDPAAPALILGAHYDTARGPPGADDNASGVAALLAVAEELRDKPIRAPVRFVFFANEEPPFFQTIDMGSWRYAQEVKRRGDRVLGMISLEMLGFYADEPKSQSYPPLVNLFYPNTGNFIALVGDMKSVSFVKRVKAAMSGFPVECACLPRWVPGIDFSDHWSFWESGFPAAMLTDTAFYRNSHYHCGTDTPEKLDYVRLASLTGTIARAALDLAK